MVPANTPLSDKQSQLLSKDLPHHSAVVAKPVLSTHVILTAHKGGFVHLLDLSDGTVCRALVCRGGGGRNASSIWCYTPAAPSKESYSPSGLPPTAAALPLNQKQCHPHHLHASLEKKKTHLKDQLWLQTTQLPPTQILTSASGEPRRCTRVSRIVCPVIVLV